MNQAGRGTAVVLLLAGGLAGCGSAQPRGTLAPTARVPTVAQALGCGLNSLVSAVTFEGDTPDAALQAFLDELTGAYGELEAVEWLGSDLDPLDAASPPPRWFLIYRAETHSGIGLARIDGFNGNYLAAWERLC